MEVGVWCDIRGLLIDLGVGDRWVFWKGDLCFFLVFVYGSVVDDYTSFEFIR